MKRFTFMGLALALVTCLTVQPVFATPTAFSAFQVVGTQYINAQSSGGGCSVSGSCAVFSVGNQPSITLQISGTFSATLTFETTSDGNTWVTTSFMDLSSGSLATSTTGAGQFSVANTGILSVRTRATSYSSGLAAVVATTGSTRQSLVSAGGGGGGSGTVTSVNATFAGGLVAVSGGPVTNSGTLSFSVAGTSGGVPCFNSASTWTSSAALGANLPLIGGGAGACIGAGTRQGNTTKFVTFAGSTPTTDDCAKFDVNGNIVSAGGACSSTGANAALSNLASVSINTSLLAQTGADLGSTTKPFKDIFLVGGGTYGTNYFRFTGTPTSTQTITIPNVTGTMAITTGSTSTNDCAKFDSSGRLVSAGAACGSGGGGSGTVTSVAQSFTGGLISVSGSPITTSGTLALTVAGTSGGIPYFSSGSAWTSSGALTANLPVIGGGAGASPSSGTRSGNTTAFVTTTGTQTSGDCASIDASGNHVALGTPCGSAVQTTETRTTSVTLSKDVTYCNPASGAISLTLPSVSTFSGRTFYVKQITSAANACTVVGTIDGATDDILGGIGYGTAYYSNGTTWNAKTIVTPVFADPAADIVVGWDDTDNAIKAFTIGSGLTYTHATHTLTASGLGCSGSATQVLTSDGSSGCTANAGATFATGLLSLGVNTTTAGKVKLFGGTSGDVTLQTNAVAGTSITATFPATNTVLPIAAQQLTFAGPSTARTITFPDAAITVARTDAAQTFTGAQTFSTPVAVASGGTGQSSYTDGQLLIGNSSGNTLTKATLTAGSNITITTGNGSILIAAAGGGGSGCNTSGSSGQVLVDDGAGGCSSTTATISSGAFTLGTNASTLGSVKMFGNTSGDVTIRPNAVAGTSIVATLPARTGTVALETGSAFTTGTIVLPFPVMFAAVAVCQNSTASLAFSTPTTLGAAAACVGTSAASGDPAYGTATFPLGGADTEVHGHFDLPSDWTGAVDLSLKWNSLSNASGDVVWQVQFGCTATGEVPTSISLNNTPFTAVANQTSPTAAFNVATKTGITTTGCAAGEMAFFIIHRDTDTSGDTLDQDVQLVSATFTIRRTVTIGG